MQILVYINKLDKIGSLRIHQAKLHIMRYSDTVQHTYSMYTMYDTITQAQVRMQTVKA